MYVGPAYCRAEMYAGHVACCPLVSYDEYANGTDRQTNERQAFTLRFPLLELTDMTAFVFCEIYRLLLQRLMVILTSASRLSNAC